MPINTNQDIKRPRGRPPKKAPPKTFKKKNTAPPKEENVSPSTEVPKELQLTKFSFPQAFLLFSKDQPEHRKNQIIKRDITEDGYTVILMTDKLLVFKYKKMAVGAKYKDNESYFIDNPDKLKQTDLPKGLYSIEFQGYKVDEFQKIEPHVVKTRQDYEISLYNEKLIIKVSK